MSRTAAARSDRCGRFEGDRVVGGVRLNAAAGSPERLGAALDKLLPILLQHVDFEEQHVVPTMEKSITEAEWNQMTQAATVNLAPADMPLNLTC